MSDSIDLTGLAAYGYHGVFDHEKRDGQEFLIDVSLALDTDPAAASDDVADTVHYGELAERIVAIVEGDPVDLIETLAQRILAAVLTDVRIASAAVT
ncbi:MAG: dihydroneopterin aldolase, partial [Microbacterium gubbeenense]|uniref:dihydroneopterin aldolase n=1 Tax=Microbacterium gubbeenense TaxID=159896 RepID=UPI003F9AE007